MIPALTISQPYASLIASGDKWVENRRWATSYRGPLAIHAGKGAQYLTQRELAAYPTGCVIAIAELVACLPLAAMEQLSPAQIIGRTGLIIKDVLDHEHTEGPYCWILQNIQPLDPPIDARGAQGLWNWQETADWSGHQNPRKDIEEATNKAFAECGLTQLPLF